MFVLGVMVGRGTAPVHFDTQALQKELAALRDTMLQKERDALEKAIRGEDQKAPLEFYEALKKDEPDTAVHMPVADKLPAAGPSGKGSSEPGMPPHKSRSVIMGKNNATAVKSRGAVTPSAIESKAATMGNLTIQVASMKDAAAAQRIVAKLKKDGYSAYLSRKVIPNKGIWFRVRVGSYTDRSQAIADMNRLIQDRKKPILVKK
jgi:cell division septation protein DedD